MPSDTQHGQVRALVGEMYEAARKHRFDGMTTTAYMGKAEALLAAADALDARTQATPIAQEALRERGWEMHGDSKSWMAIRAGANVAVSVLALPGQPTRVSIGGGDWVTSLSHITTMQQLSQLIELLTGQPTPGGGDSRE